MTSCDKSVLFYELRQIGPVLLQLIAQIRRSARQQQLERFEVALQGTLEVGI
jgi:hypothetical protein